MRGKERVAAALMVGMLTLTGCSEANSPTITRPAIERGTPTTERQLQWLNDLRSQRNKEIPVALVKRVATDMADSKDYPSIAASGNLLIDQYDNPKRLLDLVPFTERVNPFPMHIAFSDQLGDRARAFIQVSGNDTAYEITLIDKSNGQTRKFMGAKEDSTRYDIFLNSYLIDVGVSSWSYKLLLAKEASHLFYLRQQMDDVWNQVTQKYDVVGGASEKPVLLETANAIGNPKLNIPSLGTHFDRARDLLDYAGYWHINIDVAKLNHEGKLTDRDQATLEANIAMANLAINKGLIIPDNKGNFKWKTGVEPFSDEWIAVVDQALKN